MAGICKLSHGVLNFTINGQAYEVTEDDISIQPDEFIRQPESNGRYTVRKTSPSVSGTMHVPPNTRVNDLLGLCDGVVVVQEHNGRTWILSEASMTHDESPYDVQTGKFRFRLIARKCRELVNQGVQAGTTAQA